MNNTRDQQSPGAPPLVSVVIAAFNAAAHIETSCRSVIGQTYPNLELIVVDDGSSDETADLVRRLAASDRRIKLVQQHNLGAAAARNRGIDEAAGEFIAPLDADDIWDPTKIEHQVRRMQECGPETGMVYAWWAWIDDAGTVIDRSPRWRVEGHVVERLVEVNFTGNASVPLYRRAALRDVAGYNASWHDQACFGCEDWDLALRVAERYAIAVVPAVLVGYRRRRDSMSADCDMMWRSHQEMMATMAGRQPAISEDVITRSNGQFALYLAGVSFWSGHYLDATRWTLRARPRSLTLSVLPHVAPIVFRRLLGTEWSGTTFASGDGRFDEFGHKEPLIPYDHIYARHWHEEEWAARLSSPVLQLLAVVMATVLAGTWHWSNDGLWFQGDAPRHAATGLFFWDLLRSLPSDPFGFALSYYARYPVIFPLAEPPLFHILEGSAFAVLPPTPYVIKVLVLGFALSAGFYVALWARRRIAPFAGWAGACVVLLPAFVQYSNAVLLNVPATALSLGALYHVQEWLDTGSTRDRRLFILMSMAAVLTYYLAAIVLAIALLWALGSRRLKQVRAPILWLTAVTVVGLSVFMASAFPFLASRNAPQIERLFELRPWIFYGQQVLALTGTPWVVLGAVGIGWWLTKRPRREAAFRLALAYPAVMVCLVALPAFSDRYALLLAPIPVLAAFLGLVTAADATGRRKTAVLSVGLVALLSCGIWSGRQARVQEVSGFRDVAAYLRTTAPRDAVLYSGNYDGVFGFYLRALDPGFESRMVASHHLLYRLRQDARFNWVETPRAESADDVVSLIRRQSGCRWVAIERGPEADRPVSERYLRQAVARPDFELVQSFSVKAPGTTRVDLYRFMEPLDPAPPVDLQFPSFSALVFRGVEPIKGRR
ncbi:MAG: glycosyltransferase [Vicinamibacterales bacterium]